MASDFDWWKGAVFYQIYPRSFMDSGGDGVGDLKGATEKLDHIAKLGVDAIWLSPVFKSPMKDAGYDVSDYCDVDPLFGDLEIFDTFLARAHELGLKVIIDVIMSHTSDQHPWFQESRRDKTNPRADWYVWADPKPDGMPPNNWVSIFGGIAWSFDTKREQYYMRNFIKEQPDLNYHNSQVQDTMLEMLRFWLERGVDGFRLDVINFLFHDKELRDNPPKDPFKDGFSHQYEKLEPYNMQWHKYDKSQPENVAYMERIRSLMNEYPGTMTLGEIGDDDFIGRSAEYTEGNKYLNTAYCFALMYGDHANGANIRSAIEEFENNNKESWPSWTLCNHDNIRVTTRWGKKKGYDKNPDFAKMLMAALTCLRGTIFLYQGEELGLTESTIPYEKIQDPWGKNTWPDWQGRDGCRTPIPWDDTKPHAGFSNGDDTWLPIPTEHMDLSVSKQEADESSMLGFTREFLAWRKQHRVLIDGEIEFLPETNDELLVYKRHNDTHSAICIFNLSDQHSTLTVSKADMSDIFEAKNNQWDGNQLTLAPFGYCVLIY
ncbi:MAG: alpha-glucosidase family protein [Alphaproteobacteria bacterium]|nr:alpha-glucosidase family protein [Alphaproteobacteria bacterium]